MVEVVVVARDTERSFWHDDGSDAVFGLHRATGAETNNNHVSFNDRSALSDEEVDYREAHADSKDGDGDALVGAGEGEEVSLRVELEERLAAVKGFGDAVSPDLVADGDLQTEIQT